jgi:hypothetical protein
MAERMSELFAQDRYRQVPLPVPNPQRRDETIRQEALRRENLRQEAIGREALARENLRRQSEMAAAQAYAAKTDPGGALTREAGFYNVGKYPYEGPADPLLSDAAYKERVERAREQAFLAMRTIGFMARPDRFADRVQNRMPDMTASVEYEPSYYADMRNEGIAALGRDAGVLGIGRLPDDWQATGQ